LTYTSAFVVLPFINHHWNDDGRIKSGNDQATPGINLVDFWSVYPEFMRINWVQQASVSTWISISMFARWQHSYVHYYLLGGDTVAPCRLYATLCHAFLVSSLKDLELEMHGKG